MSKKDKLDFGDFEMDGNLDWDFEDTPKVQKLKKSSKPIDHFGEGVKDAMRSQFTDPSFLRQMLRKALPDGFGKAWDAVDTTVADTRRLYDDAAKELRPHLGSISRKIDMMVPDTAKRAKKWSSLLREKLDDGPVDNRYGSSDDDATSGGVERMLAELEQSREANAQHREAKDRVQGAIKDRIDGKRFEASYKVFGIMANEAMATRQYLQTFDTAFKRKSLELQYRSYAAQTALLNNFVKFSERSQKFQEALIHNTSLPEYAKTTNLQRMKAHGKDQLINKAHNALFGKTSRIGLAGQRLMARGREKVGDFKEMLSMIEDGIESASEASSMQSEMAEMNGGTHSGYKTAGNFAGSIGSEFLGDFISDTIKKFVSKNQGLSKKAARVGRHAVNPGSLIQKAQESKLFKGMQSSDNEMKRGAASLINTLFGLMAGESPDMTVKDLSLGSKDEDQALAIRRQTRAMTDVIPGYLARILREVTAIRTGDPKAPMLTFDSKDGRFKTESRMSADLTASLRKYATENKVDKNTYAEDFTKYRETFRGKDAKATKHDGEIDTFLANLSRSSENFDYTAKSMKGTKAFTELSPAAQKAVSKILDDRFDNDDYRTEMRRGLLADRSANTKASVGNLKEIIEEQIADGKSELLEKEGIIFKNDKGVWEINADRYYEIFDSTVKPMTSDADAKSNIRPFKSAAKASASKALTAFKNTKLFNWDYKTGTDFNAGPGVTDRKGFMGPMAQDVKRNFGDDTAPNGKELNLVNMNGYTMAAVKGLQDKVEQMGGGEGLRYLADISSGFKELLGKAKDTATSTFDEAGGLSGIASSAMGGLRSAKGAISSKLSTPTLRSENILFQIRDLLATSTDRKMARRILSRNVDSEQNPMFSVFLQKANDLIGDNPQKVTNAILGQLRDITIADKPKEIIDEIYKRSRDAATLLNAPLIGQNLRRALAKLKDKEKEGEEEANELQEALAGNSNSGDSASSIEGAEEQARANGGGGIGGILGAMGGLLGAGKKVAGGVLGALGQSAFGKKMRKGKLGSLTTKARNSKLGKQFGKDFSKLGGYKKTAGGILSKVKLRGGGLLGGALSIGSGILGAMGGGDDKKEGGDQDQAKAPEASGTNTYSAADNARNLAAAAGDKVKNAYSNVKGAFGDKDGDGQRDGGAADRMADAERARQANEERKKASIEASQRGAEAKASRNSPADNAIEKMIKMATAGLSGIAGIAGDVIGGALSFMGMGKVGGAIKGIGKLGGGLIRGAGGLLGRLGGAIFGGAPKGIVAAGRAAGGVASAGIRTAATVGGAAVKGGGLLARGVSALGSITSGVGRGVMGIASRIPGAANVARAAMTATRVVQVAGLMTGGAGGLVGSALGVIGSVIGSSVVIGAAAIAGVAYGGYKLYKYVTRNNIDEYEKIRILQYGLDGTDATKAFNNKILSLENYLLDGKLTYSNGVPSVNSRATKPEDIADIFDIDKEDTDLAGNFASWYASRFQPVFLHHVASLYKVDNKLKLSEVSKLEPAKKLEYLAKADIGGIWSYTRSPFKGLDVLSDNPKAANELINAMIKTQGEKLQNAAKEKLKSGEAKPKGDDAANANKIIKSAVPEAASNPTTKAPESGNGNVNPATTNFTSVPANSRLAKQMAARAAAGGNDPSALNNGSEESKDPPAAPQIAGANQAGGGGGGAGVGGLKTASGGIADGSTGMQFLKMGDGANIDSLHPRFKKHLVAMAQEYGQATGKSILINEGFRTREHQAALYRKYGKGRAAPPGSSLHEFGLAVDINTSITSELEKLGLLRKYGFTRPIRGETWHLEPAGIQQAIQRAKQDSSFADSAILSSLGRGGGGLGSTANAKKGGRDPQLAKSLYEAGAGTTVNLEDVSKAQTSTQTTGLASPQINGAATVPQEKMKALSGEGFASKGRGDSVQASGNFDASGSLGTGGGKYDKIKSDIAKYSAEAGADPNKMMMMAAIESSMSGQASASTTTAKGLMQFVGDTWKEQVGKHGSKYGIDPNNIRDDRAQTILAAKYMEQARPGLKKAAGGRKLEFIDEYMGHFLGPTGGATMLRAKPDEIGAKILPKLAEGNKDIFYDGKRPRTVAEIRAELQSRINAKAKQFGINMGPSSGAAAPAGASGADTTASDSPAPTATSSPTASPASPATTGGSSSGSSATTNSSPAGFDMGTQLPRINPKAGAAPSIVSGYQLPDNNIPMFSAQSKGVDQSNAIRIPSPVPSPMTQNAASVASVRATSTTDELMARMTAGTEAQTKHLASIDDTMTSKVVPLLEKIVENTGNGSKTTATPSGDAGKAGTGPDRSMSSTVANSKVKPADKSSFDNRRAVTT